MSHRPNVGQMQVRLDLDIARTVKRNTDAHKRVFKRRKSYTEFVNERLRDLFKRMPGSGQLT